MIELDENGVTIRAKRGAKTLEMDAYCKDNEFIYGTCWDQKGNKVECQ